MQDGAADDAPGLAGLTVKGPAIPTERGERSAVTFVTLRGDCHGVRRMTALRRLGSRVDGRPALARGRFTVLLLLVTVCVFASACGRDANDKIVAPPDKTSTTRVPRSTTTASTDTTGSTAPQSDIERQIVDRYEAFWKARFDANQAPPNPDDPALAQHATGQQLDNVIAETKRRRDDGLAFRARANSATHHRVRVVSVAAATAELQDCFVNDGIVYRVSNGETVDDRVVTRSVSASMSIVDGVWKLGRATVIQEWGGVAGCAVETSP